MVLSRKPKRAGHISDKRQVSVGALGQNLSYGQFLQNCLVFYGVYFLQIFLYTNFLCMVRSTDETMQNKLLSDSEGQNVLKSRTNYKIQFAEIGVRIIFPMTTNVLTSCLCIPGYPADHGTLWMMNASIIETSTSWCFQVLGGGYSLFCACFIAASLNWWRQMCSCCCEEKSRCIWMSLVCVSSHQNGNILKR